jgi:PAS domain S-box-containing protein
VPSQRLQTASSLASGAIAGDVVGALDAVNVPSYVIDRFGVIRWLNPAAERLVGDVRGRQFTDVVAPEDTREARELFARKVFGRDPATEAEVMLIGRSGEHVAVEISSAPLREGHRIVGVFGLVTQQASAPPPSPEQQPHLTPRQIQILRVLAHGHSTRQIADELHLTVATVRNHVRRLLRALGAHSRLEAVAIARRDGLLAG